MFSTAEKTRNVSVQRQQQTQQPAFFRKAGEEHFFGSPQSSSFFSPVIQAKLSVSSPDDPQEKEADAVAEQVMRMPEPAAAPAQNEDEKVQKKEEVKEKEESIQAKQEEQKEEVQAKLQAPVVSIQRKCEGCEKEEKAQAKLYRMIQRSEDSAISFDDAGESSADYNINRKELGLHGSDVIQCSGRGPPASSPQVSFESHLSSTKGSGSPLPDATKGFMESRFGADFSGVRVHTGSYAENLSRSIHAQAFTHGNDIYFNSGKYSPHTDAGSTLLAHELTHTIQQGASNTNASSAAPVAAKLISRKQMIHRSAAAVPSQLTNAVTKAKSVEGKIDANKPQGDGLRTGWEHLVEIFKTTFGEDKIISGAGGTTVEGAVAEQDIKKKRETEAKVVDATTVDRGNPRAIPSTKMGTRDAMPSWCGIFVFWALNKSGVPMPKWKLGERMIKAEAARTPGEQPMPGDIAYRNAYSHFAMVDSVNGGTVTTVNGNTAGEDNLGGQVQTVDHPLNDWTAFFNPLLIMEGSLGTGEGDAVQQKPKTLAEIRAEAQKLNRKEEENNSEHKETEQLQTKTELSNWTVDATGGLNTPSIQKADALTEPEQQEEIKTEGVANDHVLQKKQTDVSVNDQALVDEQSATNDASFNGIQAKSETTNSSLTYTNAASLQSNHVVQLRGPPVQLKADEEEQVQRSVIDDALSHTSVTQLAGCLGIDTNEISICLLRKASEIAMYIPGYKALRVILGRDPITHDDVERNGHNLLDAAFDIMPFGNLIQQKLNEEGLLDQAAEWIDGKIAGLESIVNDLFSDFDQFWNGIEFGLDMSPMGVLRDGANIVLRFINKVIDFAEDAADEIIEMIKDALLNAIVDFVKENTTAYPLLTVILGKDPITEEEVEFNGTNVLNAILELGGEEGIQQRTQMQETGTFQKVVGYIDEGITVFGNLYDTIVQNFSAIWDMVSIQSLIEPVETFNRIYNIFAEPITQVLDFMIKVGKEILKLIKEVLMQRLSAWARQQRGYALVTVIIGKDPFTDEVVPFTMENVIKGFFSLMEGGEEQYNQLKESGAIDRTVAKITAAVDRLNMTPAAIVQLFIDLWNSFSIYDLMDPIGCFQRIIDRFGEPIGRLIAFVVEIIKIVVEAILIVMNFPFDLINNIIAKAMQAFDLIKRDPVAFLKNLLRAIKEGFMQFFDNILTHLWNGLKQWFLGEVQDAGIPIPTDFTVMGIIKWLLAVLDITMEKIWKKLEERIGKPKVDKIRRMIEMAEKVADAAGEAYQFMKDVQERGFMTVMIEKVKEQLSNVWDMVLDAVKSFVMDQIIKKVTAKLLSMLDPTGIMAVVNSAIALYKAIQSFIKYLRKMLEIVNSFVEGTLQIAQGATKKAADFLEGALARGIPIVIGFLANQVGLNLSERLRDALELVREKVDKGLTWVIDKLVVLVEKLVSMGKAAIKSILKWLGLEKKFEANDGKQHKLYFSGSEESPVLMVQSNPVAFSTFINSVDVGTDEKKIKAKADAIPIAKSIDDKRMAPLDGNTEEAKEESKKKKIEEVEKLLEDLSVPTKVLFGDAALAGEPEIKNTVQGAGYGITMTSVRLNNKQKAKGSPPTGSMNSSYTILNKRRQEGNPSASYYVKGHLLNENLGGKGVWENLTPLSRKGNSDHESMVESLVKAAFDSGAIVEYNVTAVYGYGSNESQIPADDPKAAEKKAIIAEEINVPTGLQCSAYILEKQGDSFIQKQTIVNTTVPNPIGQAAATYTLSDSAARENVYLNEKKKDKIGAIEGIDSGLADKIVLAHTKNEELNGKSKFNSYTELSDARKNKAFHRVFPTAVEQEKIVSLSGLKYVKLYKAPGAAADASDV